MEVTTGHNDMLKGLAFGKKEKEKKKKPGLVYPGNEKLKGDVLFRDTKMRL